jgi:hypothetical protein
VGSTRRFPPRRPVQISWHQRRAGCIPPGVTPSAGRDAPRPSNRRMGLAQTHRAVAPLGKRTLFLGQTCSSALPCTSGSASDGELIHRQNRQRAENSPPSRTTTYGQRSAPVTCKRRTASRVCNTVSDPPTDFHLSKVTLDFFKSSPASSFLILTAEQRQQFGTNRGIGERVTQSCSIALDPRMGIVHPPRGPMAGRDAAFRSRRYAQTSTEPCILPSWCADSGDGEYDKAVSTVKNFLSNTSPTSMENGTLNHAAISMAASSRPARERRLRSAVARRGRRRRTGRAPPGWRTSSGSRRYPAPLSASTRP